MRQRNLVFRREHPGDVLRINRLEWTCPLENKGRQMPPCYNLNLGSRRWRIGSQTLRLLMCGKAVMLIPRMEETPPAAPLLSPRGHCQLGLDTLSEGRLWHTAVSVPNPISGKRTDTEAVLRALFIDLNKTY